MSRAKFPQLSNEYVIDTRICIIEILLVMKNFLSEFMKEPSTFSSSEVILRFGTLPAQFQLYDSDNLPADHGFMAAIRDGSIANRASHKYQVENKFFI